MAEVYIPKLGDNIEGAEITAILVAVGDSVVIGQALLEVESDKAAVEIPSPQAGTVSAIYLAVGDTVSEGQAFMALTSEGTNEGAVSQTPEPPIPQTLPTPVPAQAPPQAEPPLPSATTIQTVEIPKLGDGIAEAEITAIRVAVGDLIAVDQTLLELESDKATVEMPAPFGGYLRTIEVKAGDTVSPGQVVMRLEVGSTAPSSPTPPASQPAPEQASALPAKMAKKAPSDPSPPLLALPPVDKPTLGNPVPASPAVRRFARELGVEIQRVTGSGPRGRISVADVKRFVKQQLQNPVATVSSGGSLAIPALPDFSQWGSVRIEKASKIRKATAQQMSLAWNQIPHVTQYDTADITEIEAFRKGLGAKLAGGKLTVTAILLKITALALKHFESFNASLDMQNQQIIYKDYVHVGVAVDTPRGLLVPVIRNADKKGIKSLSNELGELAAKARDRKLSPDDMSGASFTISNLGGLGTTYFTPIVNWPEVAILGVGRAKMEPVWQEGSFVPRLIMPLSISYDHRLIDGANAARFLRWIAQALESPLAVLMEGEA